MITPFNYDASLRPDGKFGVTLSRLRMDTQPIFGGEPLLYSFHLNFHNEVPLLGIPTDDEYNHAMSINGGEVERFHAYWDEVGGMTGNDHNVAIKFDHPILRPTLPSNDPAYREELEEISNHTGMADEIFKRLRNGERPGLIIHRQFRSTKQQSFYEEYLSLGYTRSPLISFGWVLNK